MKFSMNGFRRSFSEDVKELRDLAQSIVRDEHYDKEDLIKAVNNVICNSNCLNCVYTADDPDFSDMSDLEVPLLEEEEDE